MIQYEHPFSEHTRTLLRLENLHERFAFSLAEDNANDHHIALTIFFEIAEIAARNDLRTDLIKELEKQRKSLSGLSGNPKIESSRLEAVLYEVESHLVAIDQQSSKSLQSLLNNEWLTSIRSRVVIPGGTCNFDLPFYYAWQHRSVEQRRTNISQWAAPFLPLTKAAIFVLQLARQSGIQTKVLAQKGCYQQMLTGRNFRLMQVGMADDQHAIPEISANKYMIWVRFMLQNDGERPRPTEEDIPFSLTLCAF